MKKVLSTLILGLLALTSFAKDRLIVAPAPMGIELKHDFEVKARIHGGEWQDVSAYAFKVDRVANANHNVEITSVAKFEFEGKVEILVKSIAQDIKSYKIRPNSYGIKAIQGYTRGQHADLLARMPNMGIIAGYDHRRHGEHLRERPCGELDFHQVT